MILDTFLAQIAPYDCLGCSAEGRLICKKCQLKLSPLPSRCYRCHAVTDANKTCNSCRSQSLLYSVLAATHYAGLAKDLVWKLKFDGAQAAAREMAQLLASRLYGASNALLVPVPTATSRVRARSYDQAVLLAKAISKQTNLPQARVLRRLGQGHQVGAGRHERITQLSDAYRVVGGDQLKDRLIILVDDVVTTGATLEAAAKVIKAAGARRVSAVVFAQA